MGADGTVSAGRANQLNKLTLTTSRPSEPGRFNFESELEGEGELDDRPALVASLSTCTR